VAGARHRMVRRRYAALRLTPVGRSVRRTVRLARPRISQKAFCASLTRRCGGRRGMLCGLGQCRVACAPAMLTRFSSGRSMLSSGRSMLSVHRLRGIKMAVPVANALFNPTFLILVAASAALVISIGVLLTWPSAQREAHGSGLASSSRRKS
jgi:hypothetical protein